MIDTEGQTVGKSLQQKLGGTLVSDIMGKKGRYTEIKDIETDEEIITNEIIEIYELRGFHSNGGSMFSREGIDGYINVVQSYFPEHQLLKITEDTSQFDN